MGSLAGTVLSALAKNSAQSCGELVEIHRLSLRFKQKFSGYVCFSD